MIEHEIEFAAENCATSTLWVRKKMKVRERERCCSRELDFRAKGAFLLNQVADKNIGNGSNNPHAFM